MRSALKAVCGHRCTSPRRTTGGPVMPLTPPIKPLSRPAPQVARVGLRRGFPDFSAIIPAPVRATRPVAVRMKSASKVARA